MIDTEKMRQDKVSGLRYEKPIVKDRNPWNIMQGLYTTERECEDVYRYLDIDRRGISKYFDFGCR